MYYEWGGDDDDEDDGADEVVPLLSVSYPEDFFWAPERLRSALVLALFRSFFFFHQWVRGRVKSRIGGLPFFPKQHADGFLSWVRFGSRIHSHDENRNATSFHFFHLLFQFFHSS